MLLNGSPGLSSLVESRIEEAIARGELDNLPGAGRALEADIDPLVPEELRVACRVMRSANLVPAEFESLAEINRLLSAVASNGEERADLKGNTSSTDVDRGDHDGDRGGDRAVDHGDDPQARAAAARRLRALVIQLELSGRVATARAVWLRYEDALAARLR